MMRKIFVILTLLWMLAIFGFSAQDADESSQMSLGIGKAVGEVFVEEYDTWPSEKQLSFVETIELPIRKAAHVSEYTLLGILLMGAWCGRWKWAFFTGAAYAACDEFHQLFVPGRSGQFTDVCIDSTGVILGILIFCLFRRIISEKR